MIPSLKRDLARLAAAALLVIGLAGCTRTDSAGQTTGSVQMYGDIDAGVSSTHVSR